MSWASGPVTVEVPATSANLGPGYDCLGLALELADTLVGEVTGSGLVVEVEGEGAGEVPLDETHLVVRAMRLVWDRLGTRPPGLRLRCTNRIPHSRGMGSSSAAIVGGLVLARALAADGSACSDDALLELATGLEGHPDNVAPALRGGLVVAVGGGDGTRVSVVDLPWDPRVTGVVMVPPYGVRTELARGLLPAQVPHGEAAANAARTALLVATLAGRPTRELVLRGTEDFLHQSYRRPAMQESLTLVEELRAAGLPATISGAGPTVLALVLGDERWPAEQQHAFLADAVPAGWRLQRQVVGGPGARVLA